MKKKPEHKKISNPLIMKGELTIRHAVKFQADLEEALAQYPHLTIQLEEVEEIDTTFLQLILAARQSAEQHGKMLSVSAQLNPDLQQLLKQAGVYEILIPNN